MKMSECNNGKGGGSVKPYVIIKGGFSQPLTTPYRGGGFKNPKNCLT